MDTLTLLEHHPVILYVATVLLGLVVGSFLNVVILRLPRIMEAQWRQECTELLGTGAPNDGPPARFSLAYPPSHCPVCEHRIRPWENIPILSWLLLRGRCSACGTRIAPRYPLVEAATAFLSWVAVWHFGPSWQAAAALVLTWGLVALAVIDFDTQLLPDGITLPLLWVGLFLSLFGVFTDSSSAILGAVCGYMSLWLVFHLFRLLTGKEGMGHGDFKLLALFGAWLGWAALPQIILLSAIPGAVFGVGLILSGRQDSQTPIPFGPFLAIAGWASLIWGQGINAAYLQWSGLG